PGSGRVSRSRSRRSRTLPARTSSGGFCSTRSRTASCSVRKETASRTPGRRLFTRSRSRSARTSPKWLGRPRSVAEARRLAARQRAIPIKGTCDERVRDQGARRFDVGCVCAPARQAQGVRVRRLLVHVVPFAGGQARGREGPPVEGASRSRG